MVSTIPRITTSPSNTGKIGTRLRGSRFSPPAMGRTGPARGSIWPARPAPGPGKSTARSSHSPRRGSRSAWAGESAMLTSEENQLLTQVGPGTPGGEWLRRYWHPVAAARELTPEKSRKRVRVLGEDLVLYRTDSGD